MDSIARKTAVWAAHSSCLSRKSAICLCAEELMLCVGMTFQVILVVACFQVSLEDVEVTPVY